MSDHHSSVTRRASVPTSSSSYHTTEGSSSARQRNDQERTSARMSTDLELNQAKRKSNAFLAAEAVQQERDAIKTLKRLSMGGSLTLDPDLPYGVDNEFEDFQKRQTRHRSSSGSSISSSNSFEDDSDNSFANDNDSSYDDEYDADKTLIEDPSSSSTTAITTTTSPSIIRTVDEDPEDIKIDSERLMWVPAKSHPNIAPDQFRRHVQSTLDDMTKKQHSREKKSSDSIPSLKELTDELDKLSEMAGLAATDAVTLARSLSSASDSSSLLYGENPSHGSQSVPSSPLFGTSTTDSPHSTTSDVDSSNEGDLKGEEQYQEVDQDAPLLAFGNTLKRNKWTTYTRRNRMDKDKQKRRHSPLSDEHFKAFQQSNSFGEYSKELPAQPDKSVPMRQDGQQHHHQHHHQNQQQNQQQHQHQQQHHPQQQQHHHQQHHHHQHQHQHHHQQQQHHIQTQRSVSTGEPSRDQRDHRGHSNQLSRSQSDIVSAASKKTNHSRNRHAGSLITGNPGTDGTTSGSIPPPLSKQPQSDAQRRISPLSVDVRAAEKGTPHIQHSQQHQGQTPPITPTSPRTPPLQQYGRPETQVTKEVPEPPTPMQPIVPKEKEKEKEKEKSKSKDFLNMFKMKRSTSPKSPKDNKKVITPTRSTFFNDENSPNGGSEKSYPNQQYQQQNSPPHQQQQGNQQHSQQEQYPQQHAQAQPQQNSAQRPSLRPNSFKLLKQRDTSKKEQKSLQDSVQVVPKRATRSSSSSSIPTQRTPSQSSTSSQTPHPQNHQEQPHQPQQDQTQSDEQHRHAQRELLSRKLSAENIQKPSKPNAPVQFTDSAFGFPLPPLSHSTIIMLDYRFPVHVERALYRLSHLKLANPRRALRQQVLLSNFMYAYLNLVNHTLYLQQLDEEKNGTSAGLDALNEG